PAKPAPAAAPVMTAPTADSVLADARKALAADLADPSPRIRLLAAAALARTGDAGVAATLAEALPGEPSEIRRLEFAYALALARDARGTDYLIGALKSARRDVRLEAARSLALLGDKRGEDRLREALD